MVLSFFSIEKRTDTQPIFVSRTTILLLTIFDFLWLARATSCVVHVCLNVCAFFLPFSLTLSVNFFSSSIFFSSPINVENETNSLKANNNNQINISKPNLKGNKMSLKQWTTWREQYEGAAYKEEQNEF